MINFDFPNSLVDYIHRVGRTGRVSHAAQQVTCHATSFVSHNRDARMSRAIQVCLTHAQMTLSSFHVARGNGSSTRNTVPKCNAVVTRPRPLRNFEIADSCILFRIGNNFV